MFNKMIAFRSLHKHSVTVMTDVLKTDCSQMYPFFKTYIRQAVYRFVV